MKDNFNLSPIEINLMLIEFHLTIPDKDTIFDKNICFPCTKTK